MKNTIKLLFCALIFNLSASAQTSADYNYSVGASVFNMMQLPKVLNQTDNVKYVTDFGNNIVFKFNDNEINYRIKIGYYSGNTDFKNNCQTCEIAKGKTTDYSIKLGFEKNLNYSRIQPYFAFDLGYRTNRFEGNLNNANAVASTGAQSVLATKNGFVLTPNVGIKLNIIPQLNIYLESGMDFFYSYEKQDLTDPNGVKTINHYNKWDFLFSPISAGIVFNINRKN